MTVTDPSPIAHVLDADLGDVDPAIAAVLDAELRRQRSGLEMIASENVAPRSVLQAQGSVLTNKYAEGYPGRRYYGGCEHVDVAERLAIERAQALFGATHVNLQPHSGAQANAAVLAAIAQPGDVLLGQELSHGGHLTHGMRANFSGRLYDARSYGVDRTSYRLDMDQVRERALAERPRVLVAGWSAYPRHLDYAAFRAIADEVGAVLWADMAHVAGLVATGLHPDPVPYADIVTTTTHKTLGGPRGGLILCGAEWARAVDSAIFPGQQGGPLMHVIAAKATALLLAGRPEFRERQQRVLRGAEIVAERLSAPDVAAAGISVLTGGTDVHLVLLDLRDAALSGLDAERCLGDLGITTNRNVVPFDPRPASVASGLRLGTPALAARGFGDAAFAELADVVAQALLGAAGPDSLRARIDRLVAEHPLYAGEPARP
ncbi:serine hydroxymethyltransferase [Nocardioides sp. LMS-CY]|uniref:serine hydroxymethyltransferase n=1 Tax=Nocardioides sp. (strain LMS-CY) TaxID=2840457 RepID=UPI001C0042FD|nr:serine hydroxymethyltransferase [Nocardioides sp. LMS-CY]QWF23132.1 serine hydroxymethyltransferase [Nocardioides sp. LMS-CY]